MTPTLLSTGIRYFIVVAESRSLSAAAERLHVAVSAVSRQISKLEDMCGCALIDRTTRGVELTPAGERLARFAKLIRHDEAHILEEVRGAAVHGTGVVRVGGVEGLSNDFLPSVMREFRKKFQDVSLELHVAAPNEVSQMLRQGDVDVVLKYCTVPELGLESVYTHASPIMALMAKTHPLANFRKLKAKQLVHHALAMPNVGNTVRTAFDLCCSQQGLEYTPAFTGNAAGMTMLAVQGDAIMLSGQLGVAHMIKAKQLRAIRIEEENLQSRSIQVLLLHGRTLPRIADAFVRDLIDAVKRS